MKKNKALVFKSAKEFGRYLGLTDLEMKIMNEKSRIVRKLRKSREKAGMTQAELAKLIGTKQPAIARMESGQLADVSFDFLCRVAIALKISITIRPPKDDAA